MNQKTTLKRGIAASAMLTLLAAYGCEQPNPYKLAGSPPDCPPPPGVTPNTSATTGSGSGAVTGTSAASTGSGSTTSTTPETPTTELDEREVNYSEAMRVAYLKTVGNLPPLARVYEMADAEEADKKVLYEQIVDELMNDPRFATQMIQMYRETFKMFGVPTDFGETGPSRETAPTFAARVLVEGQDWRNVLRQTSNTCPTYDTATNQFVDGECANAQSLIDEGETSVGLLTDPGIHALYEGNLAFRRNRFFHETFLCKFGNLPLPEQTASPASGTYCNGEGTIPAAYQGGWHFDDIAGECNGGRVDFHEYNDNTICAQCHGTWNHRAPLWGFFDGEGMYDKDPDGNGMVDEYAVHVPVTGEPRALISDWLTPGQLFYWKKEMAPVANLAELGQRMTEDDEVVSCAIKRVWNFAMSRGDIVDDRATASVPSQVVQPLVDDFKANNYNMRAALKAILLHDDFVRF